MKNKVVLFYPPYADPPLGAPLCLLSLAAPLLDAGFRVSIIDGAIVPDFENAISAEIGDALCFGVSLLTGPMIRAAIDVARQVRRARPDLPAIFCGWDPNPLTPPKFYTHLLYRNARGEG